MTPRIPLLRPELPQPEQWASFWKGWSCALGKYSNFGPVHEMLSQMLPSYTGGPTLPVSNGTVAITIALQMMGIGKHDRVAVPEFTVPATINAVIATGATPVLCPVNPISWQLSVSSVPDDIQAVVVVSPFGNAVNTEAYDEWAKKRHLQIVYDLAGAWGFFPKTIWPRTYSWHATKTFSIGEGGCIVFDSEEQRESARRLTNFGICPDGTIQASCGTNAKLDEIHSAMAFSILQTHTRIDRRLERRRKIRAFYASELGASFPNNPNDCPSLCVLSIPGHADLDQVVAKLAASEIIAKRYYYPLLSNIFVFKKYRSEFTSDERMERCLALPFDVTDDEMTEVVSAIKNAIH